MLVINQNFHRINQENYCYRSWNYHWMRGCGTSVARQGSAVGRRQCNCKTSSRAARSRVADVAPPRYPHVRGRSVALRTARSARATVAAGVGTGGYHQAWN
jgi:hypothetical protein